MQRRFNNSGRMHALTALVAMVLFLFPAAAARAATYGNVSVTVSSPELAQTTHGYVEYRFMVVNHSPDTTHRVGLVMEGYGGGLQIKQMRRTVDVPAGSTMNVSMFQPAVPLNGHGVQVVIDGRRQEESLSISPPGHGHTYGWHGTGQQVAVLVGRAVTGDVRDQINREVTSLSAPGHAHRGAGGEVATRAEMDVRGWSTHWLSYTRWDGIVLTAQELDSMPHPIRDAVEQYVTAGGTMLVLGAYEPPERWRTSDRGSISNDPSIVMYDVGFGAVWSVQAPGGAGDWSKVLGGWTQSHWRGLHRMWAAAAQPWQGHIGVEEANRRFPVVDHLGIPARGMLALMAVFVVVTGPLNLAVLGRMNRRVWLLWTTPAIALVFSGAVFGYALVAEGWTARGRTTQFTLLDQASHRATTLGWIGYYAPLTPGGGARFSRETELTPLVQSDPWDRDGSSVTLDWSLDQHLASGWITARVPAHFKVRKSETRRERLVVSRDAQGTLVVVNGLGATITQLDLADESGNIHHAQVIAPGEKVKLTLRRESTGHTTHFLHSFYAGDWLNVESVIDGARDQLAPLTYLATLDQAIFIEPGIEHVDGQQESAVVYGLVEEIARGN